MLTVRNLPPDPTLRDWAWGNAQLLITLGALTTTLLSIAAARPGLNDSAWYTVTFLEGGLTYERMKDLSTCRAASTDTTPCLSGAQIEGRLNN